MTLASESGSRSGRPTTPTLTWGKWEALMPRIGRRIAVIGFVAAALLGPGLLGPALAEPPKFQVDPTWPQTLPSNWIIGTIGGIFVDAQDHIWINQRPSSLDAREKRASTATNVICCVPAPPVIEFDQAGKVVQLGWGRSRLQVGQRRARHLRRPQQFRLGRRQCRDRKVGEDGRAYVVDAE